MENETTNMLVNEFGFALFVPANRYIGEGERYLKTPEGIIVYFVGDAETGYTVTYPTGHSTMHTCLPQESWISRHQLRSELNLETEKQRRRNRPFRITPAGTKN